ncbi:MAG: hypothetical protein ACP5DX_07060 [Paracoccaceae bacterium]
MIDLCGDKSLTDYNKADANAFRDALISRGLAGSSITRIFGTVRAVFSFAVGEEGLSITSPFANVHYDRNAGVAERVSIPVPDIRSVRERCYQIGDEMRWLVALATDTGMLVRTRSVVRGRRYQRPKRGPSSY